MALFFTCLGVLLVCGAAMDVFQTLFHPAGRGALSEWLARLTWRVFRVSRQRRILTYAGPVAFLLVIVSWAAFTWLGFAFIYLPYLSTGFYFGQTSAGSPHVGIREALNLSLGALISLSEGSYANVHWLQFVRGTEAVIGFGLLTASVSWLLSIYPVLETRRSVAQAATLLHNAERETHLDLVRDAPEKAQDWIFEIGQEVAALRNQMAQFPITYYFHMNESETALAGVLSYLDELAARASGDPTPGLKLAGAILGGAVESFLEMVAEDFVSMPLDDKQAILRAYASEYMTDMILQRRTIPYPRKKAS
jgi:hypothetical protein